MPSIEIVLPANVVQRRRADGTNRYYFIVRRGRPSNWPKAIAFYADGICAADEKDAPARFVAALVAWANALQVKLDRARTGIPEAVVAHGSLPWVWEQYKREDRFTSKAEPTRKGYEKLARYMRSWSQRLGHPHVRTYNYEGVRAFIDGWRDTPHQRRAVQRFLSLIFKHAMRLRMRDDNPAAEMELYVPKSMITIWEEPETNLLVSVADAIGRASIGNAILICHEIGPREEDVIAMKAPDHYGDSMFRFITSKTKEKLSIPATERLRQRLTVDGLPVHRHLVVHESTKKRYKIDHFRHVFAEIRATAGAIMCVQALAEMIVPRQQSSFIDVSNLKYRQLRHTSVVNLARASCTVPEIAAITGHSIQTVTQIIEHYLPRDSIVAGNAIAKLERSRART